jgi:hypothetical protein
LAGDDDYLRGATSINHQVALPANFKMYSRSAKGGEKWDPNRNPWLAKMICNMHIHKMWTANFVCKRQSSCNLAAILKNGRLPGGQALILFLYEPNNICAKFGACITKCTILLNFGVKKLHYYAPEFRER